MFFYFFLRPYMCYRMILCFPQLRLTSDCLQKLSVLSSGVVSKHLFIPAYRASSTGVICPYKWCNYTVNRTTVITISICNRVVAFYWA